MMIETRDILANGLSSSAVVRRPKPFIGMLVYDCFEQQFDVVQRIRPKDGLVFVSNQEPITPASLLLPGEPGCPWPPPEGLRHEWQEDQRAYIMLATRQWHDAVVRDIGGQLWFAVYAGADTMFKPIYTPALYIPEESEKECSLCKDPTFLPSHNGSSRCESGSIASGGDKEHCTCDTCF